MKEGNNLTKGRRHTSSMPLLRRKRPLSSALFAAAIMFTTAATVFVEANEETRCGPSLACQNGGVCRQGDASWPGDGSSNGNRLPSSLEGTNIGGRYCECSKNSEGTTFTGLSCEIPYQECNYSTGYAVCYHGGSCLDVAPTSWDHDDTPVCNCETAIHDGSRYAGRNCEVLTKESSCQESYCLNGGVCSREPDPTTGSHCTCSSGYTGTRCETEVSSAPDECDLECHHGGTCQFVSTITTDEESGAPWGSLNGMFCQCLTGYSGVQCEHIVQQCGDKLACLHGSTCFVNEERNEFECQCAPSEYYIGGVCVNRNKNVVNETVEAALNKHVRVTHCNPISAAEFAYGMAIPSFCANGGTCREETLDGLLWSFCDCPDAFSGPHCEFVRSASDGQGRGFYKPPTTSIPVSEQHKDDNGYSFRKNHLAGNIILWTLFSFGCVWLIREGHRKYITRKRSSEEVVLNLQSFREENPGAVSANGSMLFPSAMSAHRITSGSQFTIEELMQDIDIT